MEIEKSRARQSDYPSITEKQWETLSIVTAFFTLVGFLVLWIWLLEEGLEQNDVWKVQLFAPFGVAMFALVTYCTVNWRGKITTRQADVAAQQAALSERESKAKLLQEGAKLLGEDGRQSHISAGIATLGILITGDDDGFARQAMNLIADFIQREMRHSHNHVHQAESFAALKSGAILGRRADRSLIFNAINDDHEDDPSWQPLEGVETTFHGGTLSAGFDWENPPLPDAACHSVRIYSFQIGDLDRRFVACTFDNCDIVTVSAPLDADDGSGNGNRYSFCDFSGAVFNKAGYVKDIRNGNNYFRAKRRPTLKSGELVGQWEDYLHNGRPSEPRPF